MSAIAQAQRSKHADLRRWSPTGHHDARTNQQAVHQTYPQSLPSAPVIRHQTANSVDPTPQIIAAIASGPVVPQAVSLKSP